jgi:hypothetical protein
MVSALFKVVVCTCIHEMSGKDTLSSHLSKRLSDPATGSADRFAKYTLETLQLNQLLESIDAGKFVERKLIPTDTKGRHGNFEQDRVEQVFEEGGFDNLEEHVSKEQLGATLPITLDVRGMGLDPSKKYYCKQKYVVGIKKRKDGRPKKFDFVILVDGKPRHLFEVNFYSTTGTKIGINKDEYRLMNSLIKEGLNSKFHWITDGNYWLTQGGMADLDELRKELDIYNINTLRENLHRFVT